MPYSVPTPPPASLSTTPTNSFTHARAVSSTQPVHYHKFSDEKGSGAFAPLGSLPRRGPGPSLTGNPRATSATAKRFHFKSSPEASSSESSDDDEGRGQDSPLKIKRVGSDHDNEDRSYGLPPLKLRVNRLGSPSFNGVPFPRSSPLSSPVLGSPLPSPTRTPSGLLSPLALNSPTTEIASFNSPSNETSTQIPISASNPIYSPYKYSPQDGTAFPLPLRPSPTRSTSSPHIISSSGRPLKSSLKGSSSASSIHSHPVHHIHQFHCSHQRASSAPSTPGYELIGDHSTPSSPNSSASNPSAPGSGTISPTTPKSVHFPSLPTHLERVRIFHKSAKPAALLAARAQGEETETETETDRGSDWGYGFRGMTTARPSHASFPFPRMNNSPLSSSNSVWPPSPAVGASEYQNGATKLELDMTGYPVPNPASIPPVPGTNILLESISLSSSLPEDKLHLQGAFIVRNLAFHKDVAVRFTADDWSTVSEIKASWTANFPSPFLAQRSSIKDTDTWDRFTFSLNLSDYTLASLPSKVIYFVGRYNTPGGEYWDNCGGRNWRVKFKLVKVNQDLQQPADLPTVSTSKPVVLPNVVVSSPTISPPAISKPEVTSASSTLLASSTTSLTTSSSAPASIVAPPSPARTEAVAQATANRLRRFSLSNYVAPGAPPTSSTSAQSEGKESIDTAQKSSPPLDTQLNIADKGQPWERLSILTTPSSPKNSSTISPPNSKPSSPPSSSSLNIPTPPAEANSDSLYNWFVQQWCFAEMPSSGLSGQSWKERGDHPPDITKGNLGLEIGG
ncbi:putative phosphatase regulatory subunit-domain-containing protein [Lentinula guzmanii]|uniref:Phosphatase regulatory subunit-domain-containing protein n=1 Tax=Lentinula guzmanii TaxID=2804957 RepID=A0AA38JDJ6_9AGAR|nr:putative phosphatase regulatory subunit-domain-containing protein [Lentinula guzmanii]